MKAIKNPTEHALQPGDAASLYFIKRTERLRLISRVILR
jgi:hypothetical protein